MHMLIFYIPNHLGHLTVAHRKGPVTVLPVKLSQISMLRFHPLRGVPLDTL